MKYFWLSLICSKCLLAAPIFDSQADLETYLLNSNLFYEKYVAEQKDALASIGITSSVHFTPGTNPVLNPPAHTTSPSNPSPPPSLAGYLPFVIVNNSGKTDANVYISIIGAMVEPGSSLGTTQKMYATFADGNTGVGSYTYVPSTDSGSVPTTLLTSLMPMGTNTWGFYLPASQSGMYATNGIAGARIYVQVNNATSIITYSNGALTEPSVLNQSLASYSIVFDKFEFAYVPSGSPQISCDATAVDFFSIPLYVYMSTPDGLVNTTGIYESQSFVMKQTVPYYFNNVCTGAAILAQWNNLFSPNTTSPIRVLSPAQAASVPADSTFPNKFDSNYFDHASAYGFSYLQFLWYGSKSFYRINPLYIAIPNLNVYPQPPEGYYTASIDGSNNMDFFPAFTTESQSYFPAPTMQNINSPSISGPTSFQIFGGDNLNTTFAANLQGNQVSKAFEEALILGLFPVAFTTSNPLSNPYMMANSANYFMNFNKLPASAGGPWYDVYSQAIHYCGNIYAYAFDDAVFSTVQLNCSTPTSSTYIGITIGPCDLTP